MTTAAMMVLTLWLHSSGGGQSAKPGVEPEVVVDLKTASCASYLEVVEARDGRADVYLVWAHGFHAATAGIDETNAPPMTSRTVEEFGERLQKACREDPKGLWIKVVRSLKGW